MGALAFLARRFVAGETTESAITAGRKLCARDIGATFDLLGEDVRDALAARRIAAANIELLRRIPQELDRNISIKLTNLGLDVSEELCLELTATVLDVARDVSDFVRIDMEGSAHTQKTLHVFRNLRETYNNLGIVLQAYLRRTREDVREAVARGDRVRLCKGAYKEPPSVAWTKMSDVRNHFRECAHLLLEKGDHPAIATLKNTKDDPGALSWGDRIDQGREAVLEILRKVWVYVVVGIAVGAGIHGYVPTDALAGYMGKDAAWWSVPLVVIAAIPLYSNAAAMAPVLQALVEKGAALGTALAFMMAVVGVSLPETILLRGVLNPQLIGVFIGVVTLAIIITGYLFNATL